MAACIFIFLFVQRLHQFGTLQEIAENLEKGSRESDELKQLLASICVTSYSDLQTHLSDLPMLERDFPKYAEDTEVSPGHPVWGNVKLGRIPGFIYEDAKEDDTATGQASKTSEATRQNDTATGQDSTTNEHEREESTIPGEKPTNKRVNAATKVP